MKGFGLKATARVYKCDDDGKIYFLNHQSGSTKMVEAASNINLWKEWAAIEDALKEKIQITKD
jgi:hypothetical protein